MSGFHLFFPFLKDFVFPQIGTIPELNNQFKVKERETLKKRIV